MRRLRETSLAILLILESPLLIAEQAYVIDRLLIGSVTEDLLNNLPCAVLVVPVPAPVRREMAPVRTATALA